MEENQGNSVIVPRSLAIQSVLYRTAPSDVLRAARSTANAARLARSAGHLSDWSLELGDSSPEPLLPGDELDEIEAVVDREGGAFRYVYFDANLGHGGGHNRLADGGTSDLLLFLNPDGLIAPDTITELMAAVTGDVGLADARQVPIEHPKDFAIGTGDQSWASGACAMTTRRSFEEVGGFDHQTFFMYCDDVDYSWRVRLAGHRVAYAPSARVFHDKRLTPSAGVVPSEAEFYYSAEAAMLLAYKYSRPDIAEQIAESFRSSPEVAYRRAAEEFEKRKAANTLPAQLDADHGVAEFVAGNYATHRY